MSAIANDIARGEGASAEILTAIPTPWARPILFASALFDEEHPLHREVLNEWRGLLGMFCFQDQYNLALNRGEMDRGRLDLEENVVRQTTAGSAFWELLPEPRAAWRVIHLVYSGKKLIAGSSPLSLFFTATSYECPVPWKDKHAGRLIDPLLHFTRTDPADPATFDPETVRKWSGQIATLARWIEKSKENLNLVAAGELNESVKQDLNKLLGAWHKEISTALETAGCKVDVEPLEPVNPVVDARPYCYLCWNAGKAKIASECQIRTTLWKDKAEAPIVVTKRLWSEQSSLMLAEGNMIKDISLPAGEKGDKLNRRLGGELAMSWINPEQLFFTSKVLRLKLSDKAVNPGGRDLLLPLRPEAFEYYSVAELKRHFRWAPASGGITAELSVPLAHDVLWKAAKTYRNEDIITVPPGSDPVVALWPDFRATGWAHNYCFCWVNPEAKLDLEFEPLGGSESDRGVRRGRPWEGEVWRTDSLTSGILCFLLSDGRRESVGAVVPDAAKFTEAADAAKTWQVAVDFGTSNTTLAHKESETAAPRPVNIKDRVSVLTAGADTVDNRNANIKPNFMPVSAGEQWPAIQKQAIASSSCVVYNPAVPDKQMVRDAAFVPLDCVPRWPFFSVQESTCFGLKWERDTSKRVVIDAFLRHLLLLVAAEARAAGARTLTVSWSYPSALPSYLLTDISGKWDDIVTRGLHGTGIHIKLGAVTTESEAVCRYFVAEHQARAGRNALVTIDVGGGTTDIAVWQNGRLRIQSSIQLSAGSVAQYLCRNKEAWRALVVDVGNVAEWEPFELIWNHSEQRARVPAALNLLLRTSELGGAGVQLGDFLARFRTRWLDPATRIPNLRALALYSFTGMAYYAGMCLRLLAEPKAKLNVQADFDQFLCEVHVGGNGAKMLDWLATETKAFEVFGDVLTAAALPTVKIVKPMLVMRSSQPKQEVARGLLRPAAADASSMKKAARIIGESGYQWESADLNWFDDLNSDDGLNMLETGSFTAPNRFPELMRFLTIYDQAANDLGLADPKLGLTRLADVVSAEQVKAAVETKLRAPEALNPLFVEEVIAVMEDHLLGRRYGQQSAD
jgi:hypothetical protein